MNIEQINLLLVIFSSIAASFSALLFLPQLFKFLLTKNTSDTSSILFLITFIASLLWVSFGITLFLQNNISGGVNLIWQNTFVAIIVAILFTYKKINILKAKKLSITEANYCLEKNNMAKIKRKNNNSKLSKFIKFLLKEKN